MRSAGSTELWFGSLLVIAACLVWPVSDFVGHAHWQRVAWIPFQDPHRNLADTVLNILLFVPAGFFAGPGRAAVLRALLAASLLAVAGETYQVFCHNRFPSASDVAANCAGAALGAAAGMRLQARRIFRWRRC